MHHQLWATVALAASVGACALTQPDGTPKDGFDPVKIKLQAACTVNVQIDEYGNVVLDAEPVRTSRCPGDRKVVLLLDPDSVYTFALEPIGISFEANQNLNSPSPQPDCARKQRGKRYECKFTGKTGYKWKYTIRLLKNGVADVILDPTMVND